MAYLCFAGLGSLFGLAAAWQSSSLTSAVPVATTADEPLDGWTDNNGFFWSKSVRPWPPPSPVRCNTAAGLLGLYAATNDFDGGCGTSGGDDGDGPTGTGGGGSGGGDTLDDSSIKSIIIIFPQGRQRWCSHRSRDTRHKRPLGPPPIPCFATL